MVPQKERVIIKYVSNTGKRYYLMGVNGVTDSDGNNTLIKTVSFLGGWCDPGEKRGECVIREIEEETLFILRPKPEEVKYLFSDGGSSYFEYTLSENEFLELRKNYHSSISKLREEILELKRKENLLPFEEEILQKYYSLYEVILVFISERDLRKLYLGGRVNVLKIPFQVRISQNSYSGINFLFEKKIFSPPSFPARRYSKNYFSILSEEKNIRRNEV